MEVINYDIPGPDDRNAIGTRARRIRKLLEMTTGQLATEAGVDEHDVEALEEGQDVSLATALAIHRVLSGEGAGDAFFTYPRLRSIDEVEAFERQRLGSR